VTRGRVVNYDKLGEVYLDALAEDTGIPADELHTHFLRMERDGFIYRDPDGMLVLLKPDRSVFMRFPDERTPR
jgi:DNA-binding IclR family transcriptional regulator